MSASCWEPRKGKRDEEGDEEQTFSFGTELDRDLLVWLWCGGGRAAISRLLLLLLVLVRELLHLLNRRRLVTLRMDEEKTLSQLTRLLCLDLGGELRVENLACDIRPDNPVKAGPGLGCNFS